MPWKHNGTEIRVGKAWVSDSGVKHPATWTRWSDTYKKSMGLTWEDPTTPTVTDADKLQTLRELRNMKLEETDYLALSDNTLSTDMRNYRQSLRDLPATASPKITNQEELDESSVTWPTKPS